METKIGVFVSVMRDAIVNTAVESLKKEGLKFSVDTIASRLKISKKTIYKFFPDKESLAYAVYEKFYNDAEDKVKAIEESGEDIKYRLLILYNDAVFMLGKEIFNKYKLNERMYAYAAERHNKLCGKILSLIVPEASHSDEKTVRAVIEGAFEKSAEYDVAAKSVAERLAKML